MNRDKDPEEEIAEFVGFCRWVVSKHDELDRWRKKIGPLQDELASAFKARADERVADPDDGTTLKEAQEVIKQIHEQKAKDATRAQSEFLRFFRGPVGRNKNGRGYRYKKGLMGSWSHPAGFREAYQREKELPELMAVYDGCYEMVLSGELSGWTVLRLHWLASKRNPSPSLDDVTQVVRAELKNPATLPEHDDKYGRNQYRAARIICEFVHEDPITLIDARKKFKTG